MSVSSTAPVRDLRAVAQAGMAALRAGDPLEARSLFQQVTASGTADASVWVALAMAHRSLGDGASSEAAADQALQLDRANLRALLLKADARAAAGDDRAAAAFYGAALKGAGSAAPADLAAELQRAAKAVQGYQARYHEHLARELAARGYTPGASSRRFEHALALLTGSRQLYLQQPRHLYFPELPHRQFYEREEFDWLGSIEAATDEIRRELLAILADDAQAFRPYVERDPNRPGRDAYGLVGDPSWSAFYLWKHGSIVAENAARCPATMAALERAPLARTPGRTPSCLFSLLRPGARIPPHTGYVNTRLICHLPLIVPDGCAIRVGNETRAWQEGRALVFDDTVEHEAWNRSDRLRVVLLFDIWRPELTLEERELVTRLLQAVDAYGAAGVWDD
jgi:aspartate beta-hydroxylase